MAEKIITLNLVIDGKELVGNIMTTPRQRIKTALVDIVERMSKEATTAAEVEALAAAALAFNEIDLS